MENCLVSKALYQTVADKYWFIGEDASRGLCRNYGMMETNEKDKHQMTKKPVLYSVVLRSCIRPQTIRTISSFEKWFKVEAKTNNCNHILSETHKMPRNSLSKPNSTWWDPKGRRMSLLCWCILELISSLKLLKLIHDITLRALCSPTLF